MKRANIYRGGNMLSTLDLDTINSFLKTCKNEIDKRNCYFVGYRKISINGKVISANKL